MGIRKYKPTSPGRRFGSVSDFSDITTTKPEKSLLRPLKKTGFLVGHLLQPRLPKCTKGFETVDPTTVREFRIRLPRSGCGSRDRGPRTYNPSCAYGAPERFACPVTPPENRLSVRIEVGERGFKVEEPAVGS